MSIRNPKVDACLNERETWRKELERLRSILLGGGLTEELKWGKPCYTFAGSNLIVLYGLKEHCAVGFLKGALLKDPEGFLAAPGENSQSARWMKFASLREIAAKQRALRTYVQGAIAAEKAGLKVEFKAKDELVLIPELEKRLKKDAALTRAFAALTPGRQRGYNLFFSGAKQPATRESRIDKCVPRILAGKGRHDK